jgi:hypothetical protein
MSIVFLVSTMITILLVRVGLEILRHKRGFPERPQVRLRPVHYLSIAATLLTVTLLVVLRPSANSPPLLGLQALYLVSVVLLLVGMKSGT